MTNRERARLRRARFALSSLPQRSSGLFSKLICRAEKTPDYWDSNTSPFVFRHPQIVTPNEYRRIKQALSRAAAPRRFALSSLPQRSNSGAGRSPARRARLCRAPERLIFKTHLPRGENARLRGSPRGRDADRRRRVPRLWADFDCAARAARQARAFLPWFALAALAAAFPSADDCRSPNPSDR